MRLEVALERVVHAYSAGDPQGELVRYDGAGKWYVEWPTKRHRVTVADAAEIALIWQDKGGVIFPKQYGGTRLHSEIRKLRPPVAPPVVIGVDMPRFSSKVDVDQGGCWLWTAGCNHQGYGKFSFNDRTTTAHRFAYETTFGPVPDGMQIDHECHNRAAERGECPGGVGCLHRRCVNPDHMSAVTPQQNALRSPNTIGAQNARKTTCPRGHAYDIINNKGERVCRTCQNANAARYRMQAAS